MDHDLGENLGLTKEIAALVGDPNEMQYTIRKMYGNPHQVIETIRNGIAYSVVQLDDTGLKSIMAIGLNPRHANPDYQDGTALEPARREIIRQFKQAMPETEFSRLDMLDLFATRTENASELKNL